jgi:hypothetical protein
MVGGYLDVNGSDIKTDIKEVASRIGQVLAGGFL